MNLHEECLLKYLLNPLGLIKSTEELVFNNVVIERNLGGNKHLATKNKVNMRRT